MIHSSKLLILTLSLAAATVWLAVFSLPDNALHLISCSVGEGDASLITSGSTQILIDGGPNDKVLECLAKHIPFWDRKIEVVVLTHPDKDHYAGLIRVFQKYDADFFVSNGLTSSSSSYEVLENVVGGSASKTLVATKGMVIRSGLIHLDIVWPSEDFLASATSTSDDNSNDYSLVANLNYGSFDALFTGDLNPKAVPEVLETGLLHDVEYIKVPHHGSKNGLTQELLSIVTPEIAVISVGKNSYGHPHQEILDMLKKANIEILRTDQVGDIELVTDGKRWWIAQLNIR